MSKNQYELQNFNYKKCKLYIIGKICIIFTVFNILYHNNLNNSVNDLSLAAHIHNQRLNLIFKLKGLCH